MRNKIILIFVLAAVVLFSGCNAMRLLEDEEVRAEAEDILNAIEEKNNEYLYESYFTFIKEEELEKGLNEIYAIYKGQRKSLELQNVSVRRFSDTTKVVTYFIETTEHPYTLTMTYIMKSDETEYTLYGINISLFLNYVVNGAFKNYDAKTWTFFILNIVSYGLMIAALVLCLKTKIKNKVLWIILILLQVGITIVDFPNQKSINYSFISLLGMTSYSLYAHGGTVTNFFVHIFAIVFLFIRKKLNANYMREQERIRIQAENEQKLKEENEKRLIEETEQKVLEKENSSIMDEENVE